MNQLQIKGILLDLEPKTDKNANPYFRLSLQGYPGRYFYAFSYHLSPEIFTALTNAPNWINRQVLITYQEIVNPAYQDPFLKVKQIELL